MSNSTRIYLDYNATTPIMKEVGDEMVPYIYEHFGNPSSSHFHGQITKTAVEKARKQVSNMLNCSEKEIFFTSGGTESNNYAIKGYVLKHKNKGNHIITSCIEHPAVIEVCKYLESIGFRVTYLPVNKAGIIDIKELQENITKETILITIMHANNEIGSIQPISQISKIAKEQKIAFHTDAAQSIGKISVDINELGVDLLSVCSHKFYGPKGVGALYVRNGIELEKLIHGANHENGMRPGTENIIEIVGLGKACELVSQNLSKRSQHLRKMRDRLFLGLKEQIGSENVSMNGDIDFVLPNTLSISFHRMKADQLLNLISDKISASAGSACHSDKLSISSVLQALKIPTEISMGTVRLSTGTHTTEEEIDEAIEYIALKYKELKE
eukprot:gene11022-3728_t